MARRTELPTSSLPEEVNETRRMYFGQPKTVNVVSNMIEGVDLFPHQKQLVDFVDENISSEFLIHFSAAYGSGKTYSVIALAAKLESIRARGKSDVSLMYVCPSKSVRTDIAALMGVAASCSSQVTSFALATKAVFGDEVHYKYNQHTAKKSCKTEKRVERRMDEEQEYDGGKISTEILLKGIDDESTLNADHDVVIADPQTAATILASSKHEFVVFFDEFLMHAEEEALFKDNARLLHLLSSQKRVVLSSATCVTEEVISSIHQNMMAVHSNDLIKKGAIFGMGETALCEMFASDITKIHMYQCCRTVADVRRLAELIKTCVPFSRMVADSSGDSLRAQMKSHSLSCSKHDTHQVLLEKLCSTNDDSLVAKVCAMSAELLDWTVTGLKHIVRRPEVQLKNIAEDELIRAKSDLTKANRKAEDAKALLAEASKSSIGKKDPKAKGKKKDSSQEKKDYLKKDNDMAQNVLISCNERVRRLEHDATHRAQSTTIFATHDPLDALDRYFGSTYNKIVSDPRVSNKEADEWETVLKAHSIIGSVLLDVLSIAPLDKKMSESEFKLWIMLCCGVGVFSEVRGLLPQQYMEMVVKLSTRGVLPLLFADETISHGVNYVVSQIVLDRSFANFTETQSCATIMQLFGRAGRTGRCPIANIYCCHELMDLFRHYVCTDNVFAGEGTRLLQQIGLSIPKEGQEQAGCDADESKTALLFSQQKEQTTPDADESKTALPFPQQEEPTCSDSGPGLDETETLKRKRAGQGARARAKTKIEAKGLHHDDAFSFASPQPRKAQSARRKEKQVAKDYEEDK